MNTPTWLWFTVNFRPWTHSLIMASAARLSLSLPAPEGQVQNS